jgi:starch phosphorylase
MPTWDSAAADDLWTEACGKDRWLGTTETLGQNIRRVSDTRLWQFRLDASKSLVEYARGRLSRQLAGSGASPGSVERAKHLFDPNVLTLGFARRFATYKRPNLLLHNPERLLRLLTNPQRPVQLILAGKAHPADQAGQDLIREWTHFIRTTEARPHVIFLGDYDMNLTEHLVQGVDVWLNTPRRPWEASGTSGMKVLVNGGINFSELDGWWAEAYSPELGWALGDGQEHGNDPGLEVVPEFYARDANGIPVAWVARMRESMAQLTPRFSANRTVREYTEGLYLPAAAAYRLRVANSGSTGRQIVDWQNSLEQKWGEIHFCELKSRTLGEQIVFEVQLYLNALDPEMVRVELYADGASGNAPIQQEMQRVDQLAAETGCHIYTLSVSASRPAADYTARVIPYFAGVAVPLEEGRILWQH